MSEYKQGNEVVSHRVIKSVDESYEYPLDMWEERIYQQGRADERKEWELSIAELLIKYADDISLALPDTIREIQNKARIQAINEFAKALKVKYPLMYNDFGMKINNTIHKNIEDIAKQLKENIIHKYEKCGK